MKKMYTFLLIILLLTGCTYNKMEVQRSADGNILKGNLIVEEEHDVNTIESTSTEQAEISIFEEKVQQYQESVFEKIIENNRDFINEYSLNPTIDNQFFFNVDGRRYYHFRVHLLPSGINDCSYILKETRDGIEQAFEYYISERVNYCIYENGYIHHYGRGGIETEYEDLYYLDDELVNVFSYATYNMRDYLESEYGYAMDYGRDCNLLKLLSAEEWRGVFIGRMLIGEKSVWLLKFMNDAEDEFKESALGALEKSDIAASIIVTKSEDDFIEECESLMLEQGIDIEGVLSQKPLVGEERSCIWK